MRRATTQIGAPCPRAMTFPHGSGRVLAPSRGLRRACHAARLRVRGPHGPSRAHAEAAAPAPEVAAAAPAPARAQRRKQGEGEGRAQQQQQQLVETAGQPAVEQLRRQQAPTMPASAAALAAVAAVAAAGYFFAPLAGRMTAGRGAAASAEAWGWPRAPEQPPQAGGAPTSAAPQLPDSPPQPQRAQQELAVPARQKRSEAVALGAARAAAPLPRGWWASLQRVHYVSFGGDHGLLPRVALDPRRPARGAVVVFEGAADADYVAGVLRAALAGPEGGEDAGGGGGGGALAAGLAALRAEVRAGLQPVVAAAPPLLLQDMARLQGADVEVLPAGRIRHGAALGLEALSVLLQEVLAGGGGGAGGAGGGGGARRGTSPPLAAGAALSGTPPPPGGFVPVSTDLPDLLLASLGALPGSMAAAAAAVAEARGSAGLATAAQGGAPQQLPGQAGAEGEAAAAAAAAAAVPTNTTTTSSSSSSGSSSSSPAGGGDAPAEAPAALPEAWDASAVERQGEASGAGAVDAWGRWAAAAAQDEGDVAAQGGAPDSSSSAGSGGSGVSTAGLASDSSSTSSALAAPAAASAAPTNAAFKRALSILSPTFGKTPEEISSMQQGLLSEFYALEEASAGQGGAEGDDEWWLERDERAQQRAPAASPGSAPSEPASGAGSMAGSSSPAAGGGASAGGSLGAEVAALEQQLGAVLRRQEEDAPAGQGAGPPHQGSPGLGSSTRGLLAVHSQLQALQQRVGGHLSSLSSKEGLQAAGLVAGDGSLDRTAGLSAMAQLQDTLDGLKQLQRQMEAAAAAAGVDLPAGAPRVSDRVRAALGVTPEDEAAMAAGIAAARATGPAGGLISGAGGDSGASGSSGGSGGDSFNWGSSNPSKHRSTAGEAGAVVDARAEQVGAPQIPQQRQQDPVPAATSGSGGGAANSSKRAWGSWAANDRISKSGGTLLEQARSDGGGGSSGAAAAGVAAGAELGGPLGAAATEGVVSSAPVATEDGTTIVSKRAGSSRPPRTPTDPRARQDSVREALRAAADEWQAAAAAPSGGGGGGAAGEPDPDAIPAELLGGGGGGPAPWWSRRFEALYLPTLGYPDGGVGFVQADVALRPGARDVRVITFEDRHDCMHCLAVMRQWPATAGCSLTLGAMATATLERDIRTAWLEQRQQAQQRRWGDAGGPAPAGPEAPGPSPPGGVVVFRRGKLALRVGMGQEEFMQAVVYQAAAQGALGRVGYGFDD
ncbi:MAG: hypothetical protein J3K34DRAFT_164424 [Monoraphidium minutum]|nr:MAG: hypothetical protein J3K34DRAFT_164424 [Monoraphidium minutum]